MAKELKSPEGYARYAASYDQGEKYWDSFEQRNLNPYIAEAKGKKVLDAGAGTGRIAIRLQDAGAQVTALDLSPEMLARLKRKKHAVEAVLGDIEAMPFDDDSFDMVFSSLAMVHLKHVDRFLEECYRVLKDGGKAVVVNVHYRKPKILTDKSGKYTIACYNHFPRHVVEAAEKLAFSIEKEIMVYEESTIWISQILVLKK
ncbi:class I SAM-dependent methyltransferase [Candidatus Peregrinibacteria bacterium]|nr:class I SAM-dependent methyltransferase [Candidatus Peregrinibacteria bacterium]